MHITRVMHLFAGAGGGILGDVILGHQCVCAVEIDTYCQEVLSARQKDGLLPWFPLFADVKEFDGAPWKGLVDVVSGGFPCQDISVAGNGAGIEGERSGLWKEFARIVGEVQPRKVFIENSPMLRTRGLHTVIGDLADMGYSSKWGVVSASDVGATHKRKRIWIVGYTDNDGQTSTEIQRSVTEGSRCDQTREKQAGEFKGSGKQYAQLASIHSTTPREVESGLDRTIDDVANRMERITAIGNGQVPACYATAWRILNGHKFKYSFVPEHIQI